MKYHISVWWGDGWHLVNRQRKSLAGPYPSISEAMDHFDEVVDGSYTGVK